MQVKNVSARGWGVMGVYIKPGCTETVECTKADIGENPDLEIIDEVQEVKEVRDVQETQETDKAEQESEEQESDKEMTKADIVAALKEKGIKFNPASNKADLQALLDAPVAE